MSDKMVNGFSDQLAAAGTVRKVLTVTELTRQIRNCLERQIGSVWVEGEISNLRSQASGHLYFTLKDANAQISMVMFRADAAALKFKPSDGLCVIAHGEISVYEVRGQYQLVARRMEPKGLGALQLAFEQLKNKLAAEGLFDSARKRAIPPYPEHIGIVTSPTGAAIRDILNIISRRFPNIHIVINPVRVQGQGAAEEVAAAIDEFNSLNSCGALRLDVVLIARGGGSLEDLWAFNEEIVARAVARSAIPTISAIGHEIDFSICDFVADLRAPTPSAAAELVVRQRVELIERIGLLKHRLLRCTQSTLDEYAHRVELASASYVFRQPAELVQQYQQRVDDALAAVSDAIEHMLIGRRGELEILKQRLARQSPAPHILALRQRLEMLVQRQTHAVRHNQQTNGHRLRELSGRLELLNPQNVLNRGYSITTRADSGNVVTNVSQVRTGDRLRTRLRDGEVESDAI